MSREAAQSVLANLFQLPSPMEAKNENKDLQKLHYAIYLGELPTLPLVKDNVGLSVVPRGIVFPVHEYQFWDSDGNYDTNPMLKYNAQGHVLRVRWSGHVAAGVERDHGDLGFKTLWGCAGEDPTEMMELAEIFNFAEKEWLKPLNRNTFYDVPLELAMKKEWEYPNAKIRAKLNTLKIQHADWPSALKLGREIEIALGIIEQRQRQELADAKTSISKGQMPCLDQRHHLMCRATGLNAADYEVQGDAQAISMQQMMSGFADTMKDLNQQRIAPALSQSNNEMMEMLERQNALIQQMSEANKKLEERLAKLEPKAK